MAERGPKPQQVPPGRYHVEGDPPGTARRWDGSRWVGEPEAVDPGWTDPRSPDPTSWLIRPGRRAWARLVDLFVWLAILAACTGPFLSSAASEFESLSRAGLDVDLSAELERSLRVAGLAAVALVAVYEVVGNGVFRATLGKRLIGARIVDRKGNPIRFFRALVRVAPFPATQLGAEALRRYQNVDIDLIGLLVLLGIVMVVVDRRCQTPWDKVAGTLVIEA